MTPTSPPGDELIRPGAAAGPAPVEAPAAELERLLRLLAAAAFLVFFQAFMVAPLIPRLAELFAASSNIVGLAVPAYLLPYGLMQLVWGPLSDRIGRDRLILGSLVAFIVLTALTAAVGGAGGFIGVRVLTAVGASAVVPISLALIGDLFDYARRGHALGWLFGAMAGGMAFGSSAGALLEPVIGWRGLFVGVAGLATVVLASLLRRRALLHGQPSGQRRTVRQVAQGYLQLLTDRRAARTYTYVLFNAVLHSGIYTWLGLYFTRRYGLSETGVGLALLAYGVPGFVFGPVIGRLADRHGRARLIPLGLAVGAVAAFTLIPHLPVLVPAITVGLLSLGYDLTQPLLAGIVTQLSQNRGQAMGVNVFTLFIGFGLGSLLFQALLLAGFTTALVTFGTAAAIAAALALRLFATETALPG
jgi:predicted MFS family arabinose efflux permease